MDSSSLAALLEFGFDESICVLALERSGGNREMAINMILSGDMTVDESSTGRLQSDGLAIGDEKVTLLELSQYTLTDRSSSSCTSIAWTFCSSVLEALKSGKDFDTLDSLTGILFEGVSLFETISSLNGGAHLSVEELVQLLPHEKKNLQMCGIPRQFVLSASNIQEFLSGLYSDPAVLGCQAAGVVITKPPESVAVIVSPATGSVPATYYFFDSHSRPQFGFEGAYMVTCNNIEGIVRRLCLIFPPNEEGTGDSMMDMMYNSFEGTTFQIAAEAGSKTAASKSGGL